MIDLENKLDKQVVKGEYPAELFDFFNWGAFALPEIWGIVHGVWSIVVIAFVASLLPAYLLATVTLDQNATTSMYYGVLALAQVVQGAVRLWVGMNANRLYWNQIGSGKGFTFKWTRKDFTIKQFFAKQKQWALVGVLVMIFSTLIGVFWNYTAMGEASVIGNALFSVAQDLAWLIAFLIGAYYIARQGSILMAPLKRFNYLVNSDDFSLGDNALPKGHEIKALNDIVSTGVFSNEVVDVSSKRQETTGVRDVSGPSAEESSPPVEPEEVYAYPLANGEALPILGLGTYKMAEGNETIDAVTVALDAGYRSFDTASFYGNERSIATALKQCGMPREDVFLTSKLWNDQQGYVNTIRAFEDTLLALDTDYLDMYLIHWPIHETLRSTWRALEHLYTAGQIHVIGVSNFQIEHLEQLQAHAHVAPMVNQIELHPRFTREELVLYCWNHQILVQTWAPLIKGEVVKIAEIDQIARTHDKTPSQIALRWAIQHNFAVIPKSTNPQHILENAQIFDFELTAEEMKIIDSLNQDTRIGPDPQTFSWHHM